MVDEIPYGYCQCGCGGKTAIAKHNDSRHGYTKNKSQRFLKGHKKWKHARHTKDPNPSGLCQCGCGQKTKTVKFTDSAHGYYKGQHLRFIHRHYRKYFSRPSAKCKCGCEQVTQLATRDNPTLGWIKGQPMQYVRGHRRTKGQNAFNPNPSGLCMCGCGEKTTIARQNRPDRTEYLGYPKRFIAGHNGKLKTPIMQDSNPKGMCGCGCGKKTAVIKRTALRINEVKGHHRRFVYGHSQNKGVYFRKTGMTQKERHSAYNRDYAKKHHPKIVARRKEYCRTHPEAYRLYALRRRAKKTQTVCTLTPAEKRAILTAGCFFCGSHKNLAIAHDIPVSKMGNTTRANTLCLCRSCNGKMGTHSLAEMISQKSLFPRE